MRTARTASAPDRLRGGVRAAVSAGTIVGVAAAALSVAGCSGVGTGPGPTDAGVYACLGSAIPVEAVADPRPATQLGEDGQAALAAPDMNGIDPAEWFIASEEPEKVVLFRELSVPEDLGAGDVRTHERLEVGLVEPDAGVWMVTAYGSCALTLDVPGGGTATVTLDPSAPPDPTSTEVALLVTEVACNSGEDAAGRVEIAFLMETDTAVEVVLAVEPRGGDHTCPSNPPTPFTLRLDAPLGDRQLVDASVVPGRPITLPGGTLFEALRARQELADRVYPERTFADLVPPADGSDAATPISEGVIIGTVTAAEPGRAYTMGGSDAAGGTEVAFDDDAALWRTLTVTVAVERTFGPRLDGADQIRFGIPLDGAQDAHGAMNELAALGRVIVVLDPQGRFAYDPDLYGVHWDGAFLGLVGDDGRFEFPALADDVDVAFMAGLDEVAEIEQIYGAP